MKCTAQNFGQICPVLQCQAPPANWELTVCVYLPWENQPASTWQFYFFVLIKSFHRIQLKVTALESWDEVKSCSQTQKERENKKRSESIQRCKNVVSRPRGLQLCVMLAVSCLVTLAQQVMMPQISAGSRRINGGSKQRTMKPLEKIRRGGDVRC